MTEKRRILGVALVLAVLGGLVTHHQPDAGQWMPRVLLAMGVLMLTGFAWRRWQRRARARFLADFRFPAGLARKVCERYPHLSDAQAEMVLRELRTFFQVALAARGRMVSMPSQAVDVAWHEFILFTKGYRLFCRRGLGRFLDHTPAEYMATPQKCPAGIAPYLAACLPFRWHQPAQARTPADALCAGWPVADSRRISLCPRLHGAGRDALGRCLLCQRHGLRWQWRGLFR